MALTPAGRSCAPTEPVSQVTSPPSTSTAQMRWGIRGVNREGQPALVYMHPWELDPGQPRIKARGKRGISTHYINLNRTESRLNRLLRDFDFAPVRDVLGLS